MSQATTYAFEREHVGNVLTAGWQDTDAPINWPNDELAGFPTDADGNHTLPTPTGDRTDPARWLSVEFDYRAVTRASFDGDVQIDGVLMIGVHVEIGVGDGKLRQMVDDLVAIFEDADTDGLQFLEPQPELPEYIGDDWYTRQLSIPFVRFQND